MADALHRSGVVAVVGRPNTGKSTLVNALVGEKVSIVTPRPQTTRSTITGILTRESYQVVFTDTPGLHDGGGRMINRVMNRAASGSLSGADLVMLVVEASGWRDRDDYVLQLVRRAGIDCVLVLNKTDLVTPRERLLPILEEASARHAFVEVMPVSARRGTNIDRLEQVLVSRLPEGPPLYDPDTRTDRSFEFRVAEIIREKLMQALREEVPYGAAVEILAAERDADKVRVDAVIWVSKESHKGIVVGRGGQQIKHIGRAARLEMQEIFGGHFHLETRVRVRENWADDARALRRFGYDVSG